MKNIFIIGEIGINHNGDVSIAKQLISSAATAGANAVKFQKRTIDAVYTKEELNKPRESPWGTINREQKEGLELNEDQYDEINIFCEQKNIEWFASSWDIESQKFLQQFSLKYNKVASAMLVYEDLLQLIASEKKHTFISTGLCDMEDIANVVEIFKSADCPFELMHCVSTYPTKTEDANLNVMDRYKSEFGLTVGYSDHTQGIESSLAAVALGAKVLEKHITLDKKLPGPDHKASVNPEELKKMVEGIRKISIALGSGVKKVSSSERKNITIARTSIVASKFIKKGEKFTNKNLTIKRPGNGISPMKLFKVIGKIAKKKFLEDELIKL